MAARPPKASVSEDSLREAFDRLALSFDSVLVKNPINAWMHQVNMSALRSTFSPGDCLLELGCGTGTDAIELAKSGCRIFGIDISKGMVAEAHEKVVAEGLEDRVVIVPGRSRDLLQIVLQSPWSSFDGGYANFTLTYEEDLAGIAKGLAEILRPGAFFICTLPNRVVLSEVLVYGLQLRFQDFLWRLAKPLLKDVHGVKLEIRACSPWQVREAFHSYFELRALVGLPTFLPPVYLHPQYRRLGGAQLLLMWLDGHLADRYPWNRLGEHTLFKFERI